MSSTKFSAVTSILLGVAAIILPYFFGTFAVMMLGGVMLASGIVALLYVNAARKEGIPVSVFAPWVQVIAGVVILIWPGLALWIVAVILGGGLILSGITGLAALRESGLVNPPVLRKIELWSSISTWRAANRFGRRRLRHSARGSPRSRLDQYRPSTVAFG